MWHASFCLLTLTVDPGVKCSGSSVPSYRTGGSGRRVHLFLHVPFFAEDTEHHISHTAPVLTWVAVLGASFIERAPFSAGAEGDSVSAEQLPVEEATGSPCQGMRHTSG